jgi:NAD-dependent SIR2 family protein deacetylase
VTPAADVPLLAVRRGVPYVIVNRGATPHDSVATLTIEDEVGGVLERTLSALA